MSKNIAFFVAFPAVTVSTLEVHLYVRMCLSVKNVTAISSPLRADERHTSALMRWHWCLIHCSHPLYVYAYESCEVHCPLKYLGGMMRSGWTHYVIIMLLIRELLPTSRCGFPFHPRLDFIQ